MSVDFVVVQEHPQFLAFVDSLQRANVEALSFYPLSAFEREMAKGRLFLGLLNNQPSGYIYVGAGGRSVRCHQVCIQYDARRRLYGATLVAVMEKYAEDAGATSISLRCGFDLEANDFWKSLGYICVASHAGGVRRMRTINVWRKALQPELLETLAIEPAVGVTDASLWRRHKQTGLVTQFVRGKAMRDYRARLIDSAEAIK